MEREVRPLIRGWKVRALPGTSVRTSVGTTEQGGRRYRIFENVFEHGEAALVCGGIGAEAARRATEALIREVNPTRVLSVGFAGALDGSLRVGDVLQPRTVINAADGARTEIGSGVGVLVSYATVADKEQKVRLGKAYGASAVDMEAAAVVQGAEARGVEFAALKVISDAADFSLPAIARFVADDGTFRSGKFARHVAFRPWLWRTTIALARNSSKASQALCDALASYLAREANNPSAPPGEWLSGESSASDLNPTVLSQREVDRTEEDPTEDRECAAGHTQLSALPHTGLSEKR